MHNAISPACNAPSFADRFEQNPPWAELLEVFYGPDAQVPRLNLLKGHQVPQPYRELLVHSRDMTPTLESFYGLPIGLTLLNRTLDSEGSYRREVVLNAGSRAVEYGAIRIFLDEFPPTARGLILEEERPLGAILQEQQIAHVGWPQGFFSLRADRRIIENLALPESGSHVLYGRRNVLLNASRHLLAEVIEILSPVDL